MKLAKNYHDYSILKERQLHKYLTVPYGALLLSLNEIRDLNKSNIDKTISEWHKEYDEEIEDILSRHVSDLREYSRKTLNVDKKLTEEGTALYEADKAMLDVTTEYIRQKFIEVGVNEKAYGYDSQTVNNLMDEIVEQTTNKLDLFSTQSTINNIAQFIKVGIMELGFLEYKWHTQRDSKVRPSHAAMDGKWFSITDESPRPAGYKPGMDYNCFPANVRIDFADDIKGAFCRWYNGSLISLVTESGTLLEATPDHPILTNRGWLKISEINIGDQILQVVPNKHLAAISSKKSNTRIKIDSVFETILKYAKPINRCKFPSYSFFSEETKNYKTDFVKCNKNWSINQSLGLFYTDKKSCSIMRKIIDVIKGRFNIKHMMQLKSSSATKAINPKFEHVKKIIEGNGMFPVFTRVTEKEYGTFNGYVYNLQTKDEFYVANNIVVHNCRCWMSEFR